VTNGLPWRIEFFKFSDGTTLTAAEMDQLVIGVQVTSGNDTIVGGIANDVFDGGGGNDTLRGMVGGDTYQFGRVSGNDTIDDQGTSSDTDVLEFVNGIGSSDVVISRSGNNVVLQVMDASGTTAVASVTVLNMLGPNVSTIGTQNIEQIKFVDGTVWTSDMVKAMMLAKASTTGADSILGYAGTDDVIDGGVGNDALEGHSGSDTYIFGRGYGVDTVTEISSIDKDVLLFKQDILPGEIVVSRGTTTTDAILTLRGTADQVILKSVFSTTSNYVEEVRFNDGTSWSVDDLKRIFLDTAATLGNNSITGFGGNDVIDGLLGNDSIDGGNGNDRIIGGGGADTLIGGIGSDSFVFAPGSTGQSATTMESVTYLKGSVGIGDILDYSSILSAGGSAVAATATEAAINTSTGVVTFAALSGTTLADALSDITTRFTAAGDADGEFAFFKVNAAGNFHMFISDGVAGLTSNDTLIQLTGITAIGTVTNTNGDLTILT
jgi:Ca2+-binding RTX toxin-like protein